MRRTTMSIMGLYNYDPTVFEHFTLPESIINQKQAVIDEICLECAEFELIYPNLDIMKLAIKRWTELELPIWAELQSTREYEYNPIWNKDGTYIETETRQLANSRNVSTQESGTSGSTITDSVQGFNSNDWAEANKRQASGTSSDSITNAETGTDTGTITHERVEQGNIGVTTTQQMIKEQREVVSFSTERYIIDSFKKRFCLLIY